MIQLVSYNFSTVENPLSNGGNFTIISDVDFTTSLRVPSAGVCEPTTTGAIGGAFWSGTVPTVGTWPNDQYSEVKIIGVTSSSNSNFAYMVLRQGSAASGTQYIVNLNFLNNGTATSAWSAVVAGTLHTVHTFTSLNVVSGDVWRSTITGNVLTLSQNGSQVGTFTDTNNYVTSGSPGFGLNAQAAITNAQISNWAAGANVPSAGGNTSWLTVNLANSLRGVRH